MTDMNTEQELSMIAYTTVGTNDLPKAIAFYKDLLEGIFGAKVFFEGEGGTGWSVSPDKPMFAVLKPFNKEPATVGNGSMISLACANPEQVQALHAKALALGGKDEGAPGPRGGGFYAAYFRDLDGNKIGGFCMA
jgi:catechol 2,3-dioxygenase-like lactoylglutathione lyase family enzyme